MRYNVPLYFERKNIKSSDIFYLTRQNPHTIITLSSGESITTTIPIKELMLYLPEEDFLNISKGSAYLNQVPYGSVCADSDYVFSLERQHHQSLYKVLRQIYEQFDFFEEQRLLRCLENLLPVSRA